MQEKKIVIAADHAGYDLKMALISHLETTGYTVYDMGCDNATTSVDYPDMANRLAQKIKSDTIRGVLICGSGIGMSIAINRHTFIRGALASTPVLAQLAREHNNANVLVLGARFIDNHTATQILDTFLSTPFQGGRHEQRVQKLGSIHE